MVVVDDDGDVGLVFREPVLRRLVAVEEALPVRRLRLAVGDGIAYRRALKALRRRRMLAQYEDGNAVPEGQEPADRSIGLRETEDWIRQGLQHLPLEQRAAVELVYYFGHSLEEIGAIMGCPASTIKARMFHARARLRGVLSRLSGEAAS